MTRSVSTRTAVASMLRNKRTGFWYHMHVELSLKVACSFLYSLSTKKRFKNTAGEDLRETFIMLP